MFSLQVIPPTRIGVGDPKHLAYGPNKPPPFQDNCTTPTPLKEEIGVNSPDTGQCSFYPEPEIRSAGPPGRNVWDELKALLKICKRHMQWPIGAFVEKSWGTFPEEMSAEGETNLLLVVTAAKYGAVNIISSDLHPFPGRNKTRWKEEKKTSNGHIPAQDLTFTYPGY
ncbi:hypothetical protein FQN54_007990 [Arachnomyces sp. PD_36]|nr:hypothetical protein FQN54_007990 [Arachnomyces sp. PD_36]